MIGLQAFCLGLKEESLNSTATLSSDEETKSAPSEQ